MGELYPFIAPDARAMMFVDGENLAIRFKRMLGTADMPADSGIWHLENVAVCAQELNPSALTHHTRVSRNYYYTSVQGDDNKLNVVTTASTAGSGLL
jgi:hypothetical protein